MTDHVELKRKGTMQCTAQEGIQYLKDHKKDTLLQLQGLDKVEEPPVKIQKMKTLVKEDENELNDTSIAMKRTKTMAATLEEAQHVLKNFDEDGVRSKKSHESNSSDDSVDDQIECKSIPVQRTNTMEDTTQSAQHFLGSESRGDTRSQTEQNKRLKDTDSENSPTAMKRTKTIADTTSAAEYILGSESYGSSRSATKIERESKEEEEESLAMKKTKTMVDTTASAEHILGNDTYGSTRSATNAEKKVLEETADSAAMKRTGTMADTASIAKTLLKDEEILETRSQSKALKDSTTKPKK